MASIRGTYSEDSDAPATEPERIVVRGSEDEIRRIPSPHVPHPLDFHYAGPKHPWSFSAPADKEFVHEIAKRIELDCDDQRLIDWMKA